MGCMILIKHQRSVRTIALLWFNRFPQDRNKLNSNISCNRKYQSKSNKKQFLKEMYFYLQ